MWHQSPIFKNSGWEFKLNNLAVKGLIWRYNTCVFIMFIVYPANTTNIKKSTQCLTNVGPTLVIHWVDLSCLLGKYSLSAGWVSFEAECIMSFLFEKGSSGKCTTLAHKVPPPPPFRSDAPPWQIKWCFLGLRQLGETSHRVSSKLQHAHRCKTD